MLDRVLERTKGAVTQFVASEKELNDNVFTANDWETLESIRNFLRKFRDVTKSTEGRKATIELVLPLMDFLIEHFQDAIELHKDHPFLTACLNAGYTKLLKYFNKYERTPVYIAAIILNPAVKWTLFKRLWHPREVNSASKALNKMWRDDYSHSTGLPILATPNPEEVDDQNTFHKWLRDTKADMDMSKDELDRYCEEPLAQMVSTTAMEWWSQTNQRTCYPLLSQMAIDILSIPAMSAEAKRLFSSARHTINDERARLQATTIEALECMKSWFNAGWYVVDTETHEHAIETPVPS